MTCRRIMRSGLFEQEWMRGSGVTCVMLDLPGGMMFLFHHDKPVGIVRGAADEYEGEPIMNIGPLAILPEYQGRGLGRILLRAALRFAKEKSYASTILSVNGENERAKTLYLQEGFRQVEAVVCYAYRLK